MTTHGGKFVDRMQPLLVSGDVPAAAELLDSLEGVELDDAKRWFDASAARIRRQFGGGGLGHDAYFGAQWIVGLAAVRLCGPRTAAKRIPWPDLWGVGRPSGDEAESLMIRSLCGRPVEWVTEFAEAASHLRLSGDSGPHQLARVVRAGVVHHGIPCPTGRTFLTEWLAGTPAGNYRCGAPAMTDWLVIDPLMPDLMWGFLRTGECGRVAALPDVVASLVDSGHVSRSTLIDVVLQELTTQQRPKSQQVLAELLGAVNLRPDEVPGGLGFLLGVLSTSHRSVQPVLLPLALALAAESEDWRAIVDLVSGRPEKWAKEQVLTALRHAVAHGEVGGDSAARLLVELGTGDDAAFNAKVAKVRTALAPVAPDPQPEQSVPLLGLWDLPPAPGRPEPPHFFRVRYRREPGWGDLLSSRFVYPEDIRPWLVDSALEAMAEGTFDASEAEDAAAHLLGRQEFLSSAFVTAFEDVFLAGGLRAGWETAVRVVDLAAGASTRPAGLADLVRFLGRYAAEVPHPHALPSHLTALAASTSRTKAVMEARSLSAALARTTVDELELATPGGAPDRVLPARRGLWEKVGLAAPLPSSLRIGDDDGLGARATTLTGLRDLLSENFNGFAQSYRDVCWLPEHHDDGQGLTGLTDPDRVLAATVAAIHRHGPAAVRTELRGIQRRYRPVDVVAAVDAWVDDGLDATTFWRLARATVVSESCLTKRWREQGMDVGETNARRDGLPSFGQRLRGPVDPEHGALVVPFELESPLERFAFLRAAEALLRAEQDPVVLSLPTWRDGTIDPDVFIDRLQQVKRGSGVVGPIDLVQALHRLRDADAGMVDRVPEGLRADPTFVAPDGAQEWDAIDLVRRWLRMGLPPLHPRPEDGLWQRPPTTPVPFSTLSAWPGELADDLWCPGPLLPTLRLLPRWADRTFDDAFASRALFNPVYLPSLASGPFGVPFHDRLLALICAELNQKQLQAASTLQYLARAGSLEPGAAAAAAVGRHKAGTLALGLLVKNLQRGLEGALAGLWPTALAIAGALAGVEKRPPQLAELLRLLAAYAHEVPASAAAVPEGLEALAASKGSTKAHEAARELVHTLRQTAS